MRTMKLSACVCEFLQYVPAAPSLVRPTRSGNDGWWGTMHKVGTHARGGECADGQSAWRVIPTAEDHRKSKLVGGFQVAYADILRACGHCGRLDLRPRNARNASPLMPVRLGRAFRQLLQNTAGTATDGTTQDDVLTDRACGSHLHGAGRARSPCAECFTMPNLPPYVHPS